MQRTGRPVADFGRCARKKQVMLETEFWDFLSKVNWDATGDDEAVVEPLVEALSKINIEEIYAFEEILTKKLHALDTIAHAKEIGEDAYVNDKEYFSVDLFLYARCVVVVNGESLFERVLNNPKEFPKDMEFEAILYVAQQAYEKKTGKKWEYVADTDYETYSNKEGWK
jgi:hypothetical protein